MGENELIDALADIGLGLALWDPRDRLVAYNSVFAAIHDTAGAIRPGMMRSEIEGCSDSVTPSEVSVGERHYAVSETRMPGGAKLGSWLDISWL